jgi:O-antigen/teichoic acid export membrane protein
MVSSFARGVSLTFAIQIAGAFLAYALNVLLARWMGVTEYGIYTYVFSWAMLLSTPAGLGLNTAVLRFIPEYRTGERPGLLLGIAKQSRRLTLGAGVLVALVGCGVVALISSPEYSVPLMLGLWMVPLIALMYLYQGTSRALRRVVVAFTPPLVIRPLLLIGGAFTLFLVYGHVNSRQVLTVALISLSAVVLFQRLALRRDLSSAAEDVRPERRSREWLGVAAPLLVSSGFGMLIAQTGILMVGTMGSPDEVGLYSAALKTAMLIGFIIVAVNTFTAPMLASLHSQGRLDELQRLLSRAAHMMFWPSLGIAVVMLGFSGLLLGLFGEEFIAARTAMAVLIAGQLVAAGAGTVGQLTDLTGYHRQGAWVRGYSALLTVLLSVVLIPYWGILGAAVAATGSLALKNVWLHRLATRNLGLRPSILFALSRPRVRTDHEA